MVFNPMSMFSPEQQQFLQEAQKFTTYIQAVIHRDGNVVSVSLNTDNPQAQPFVPKIQDAIISSVAQSLHLMFNIKGRID